MKLNFENINKITISKDLLLDCGVKLNKFDVAFETYGKLDKNKKNAILIFHALSGDQFVTGLNKVTGKEGWWNLVVGENKPIDTKKYFVICANVIGGCMGSTGPKEICKETGKPYGLGFPVITIKDMVKAQAYLLDHLGIDKTLAVLGGSMGGMQALQFCSLYPNKTFTAVPIACAASHSAQNIAFNELARQAIMADPEWDAGNYISTGKIPRKGLAIARMAGHISYLSEKGLQNKFGRKLQEDKELQFSFDADFQVESYLKYQGYSFVDRFDANSYLYITRAMDYFDLYKANNGNLSLAFENTKIKFCIISFSTDWLYPTSESKKIVIALNSIGAEVSFVNIITNNGHDSFLVNEPKFLDTLKGFLESNYEDFKNEN
ncbi:MAG: homoserine O-acetyltransferase [Candidatus Pelagibacter sp.]|nr:homoserine O-acetyltransferase [Candidatus Pelagibacter sp.]OUV98297.1 MAG: homoserine O-acetyltransferase [Candidatus Pelagibacter sp. TMED142]|tara:strand:+ start:196 stop:1329 length:1134 start_codon:yes stop_codon:yes gene_type:complete